MTMSRRTLLIRGGAALYLAGLVALILRIEPGVLSLSTLKAELQPDSMVFGPFQLKPFGADYLSAPTSQFRGDHRRLGVQPEERVGLDLKPETLVETVNVDVHGASKSSPAIDGTGIYVGSDSGWFYAFEHSGKLKWRFNFSNASKGIHATAVLDQKRVYIGAYNGRLYALDKETGHPDWVVEMGVALGASAIIHDNALYVSVETAHPNGYIVKINPADGRVLWTSPWLGAHPHSSPALWPERNLLFVGANNLRLHALDMRTGEIRWIFNGEGHIKGTPAFIDGKVYFTSWGRKIFALDAETGEDLWETFIGGESQTSPAFVPDENLLIVAGSSGAVTAVHAASGEIAWQIQTGIKRVIFSATVTRGPNASLPWIAWVPCEPDQICALRPRDGKVLRQWPTGALLTGVPVAWDGEIYLALNHPGGLLRLSKERGK